MKKIRPPRVRQNYVMRTLPLAVDREHERLTSQATFNVWLWQYGQTTEGQLAAAKARMDAAAQALDDSEQDPGRPESNVELDVEFHAAAGDYAALCGGLQ